jgi:hypothetical protein
MDPAGQRKAHDAGVINDNHDDGEGAEKVEAGLALAISKPRINSERKLRFSFGRWLMNARK